MESHLNPEQDALEHIVAWRDKPFLRERFINPYKGRTYISETSLLIDIDIEVFILGQILCYMHSFI